MEVCLFKFNDAECSSAAYCMYPEIICELRDLPETIEKWGKFNE